VIGRVIEWSARNRALVLLLTAMACLIGWWSMRHVPVDALPDLSDTQVIIFSKWDRSPNLIEDQVTYPIVTALLGAPKIKTVRGISDFGYSYVYVIFEDGTDLYWARSRTQEYLSGVLPNLPAGVKTTLGPDATGLGWVFQYVLVDESGTRSLADLRSIQDWYLRYHLNSVPGVSEIAGVGGFQRQYQVNIDPQRLQAFGLGINRVVDAVRGGNAESGARLLELGGAEYMIRGLGYAKGAEDIENNVVAATDDGTPIHVRDIGRVVSGPDLRRGVTDWDGRGEAVSGIVVMRNGVNALDVIRSVKKRLAEIQPGLPAGVKVRPVYDRSELVEKSIANTRRTILEVIVTVIFVIVLFLWHVPSALIPAITIPITILVSFIPFQQMGLTANIMSLGGITIAIGALVDAAIIAVEQTHKRLEQWQMAGCRGSYADVVIDAMKEVAGPSFFTLLVISVSFLPVLTLEGQEGRLFKPLAYTKTLAMLVAAVCAIILDPALRLTFTRLRVFHFKPRWAARTATALLGGRVQPEHKHPISRFLIRTYEPIVRWALRSQALVIAGAVLAVIATIPIAMEINSEFMPPLNEGTLFYMPSTMPGISITEAKRLVHVTDRVLHSFPEVRGVLGKAGRADSATDPAPLSMLETVVTLKPKSEWRRVPTWYSAWSPEWLKPLFRHITSDAISEEQLLAEMNQTLQIPGVTNAWTMPIRGRIDMLTTGIRTSLGLKIMGSDPQEVGRIGERVEAALRDVPGARSVFAERSGHGFFVDIAWDREKLGRYGLSVDDAQGILSSAVGGDNVTTVIDGRARYPVNVRYLRDFRSDRGAIEHVLIPVKDGKRQIPLAELATVHTTVGPSMIRDDEGLITGYVYVDIAEHDIASFVSRAKQILASDVKLPAGYSTRWAGRYEAIERSHERLRIILPLTVSLIFVLLWLNTRSFAKSTLVLLAVPFSAVGAFWLLAALGYSLSVAVWVGLIALLGVDAETGVFMLLYLDLAYDKALGQGRILTRADLHEAIVTGAARRIRPKVMTVVTMLAGLLPILWSTGTGADVMKRIAVPMVGGIATSFLLELLVYPVVYELWRWHGQLKRRINKEQGQETAVLIIL
jgi:Cu(I)/Ag(I) efflux system membrane protein CusA/SilA